MKKYHLVAITLSLLAVNAQAEDALLRRLQANIDNALPELKVTAARPSAVDGIYEVTLGPEIVYMSEDGRFLFSGNLMDLRERRNLSEERRTVARLEALKDIGVEDMIEFAPPKPDHVVYVFTDVDCQYCRRMHQEVQQLNAAGVSVRYLAFPRAGIGSESYKKIVSVWCAADPKRAMTDAKAGRQVKRASCENPVEQHFKMGQAMGVRGTPTVILDDGQELGGYVPAKRLLKMINGES